MTKFFGICKTLDELKKAYKAAAMKYHPDMGGDTATMQAINAEYASRFEVLKRGQNERAAEDTTGTAHATTEAPDDFIQIINVLLHMDRVTAELCGSWIWIGGETMKHKEELKEAGCKWSSSKKLWYWRHPEDAGRWHRGSKTMSQIRNKYGSQVFSAQHEERIGAAH